MIKILLWDVDGTLLDFHAAEKAAIRTLFQKFRLGECTNEMLLRYSAINRTYWERLERGELTREQVLIGRFQEFFEKEGLNANIAEAFNLAYQVSLGDTIVYCDDSLEILKSLAGKYRQYIVSNGTVVAQEKKLRLSGIGAVTDGVFLSEQLGVEKPNINFFNQVFDAIGDFKKDEVLIIGDSLTSDIRGGNNAGIKTCWYNPPHSSNQENVSVDYEITDLHEVYKILENEESVSYPV